MGGVNENCWEAFLCESLVEPAGAREISSSIGSKSRHSIAQREMTGSTSQVLLGLASMFSHQTGAGRKERQDRQSVQSQSW